ncbi:MAG: hypothetical protein BGO43_00180 [Gammaproteobacteria bacterium 39-13]|nr:tRNA (adenine(22)-N(1))-methyltransferase TrmK [Gammaproteobacteria bacterium]OJV96681.1 MAG: hypothetical protein BGO43_00180 [Gammaproteobacteria bacterium 39-13]
MSKRIRYYCYLIISFFVFMFPFQAKAEHFVEKTFLTRKQDELLAINAAIKNEYEFKILGKKFIGLPGVFSPMVFGGDGMVTKTLSLQKGLKILEIGSGTGYFSVFSALNGARKVVAVDICEAAVENTLRNAKLHQVESKIDARKGDMFSVIGPYEKFDVIFWDIPFNHTEKSNLTVLERSIYDPNCHLLTRFLNEAPLYLKPHGIAYLVYSPTHGNVDYFYAFAKKSGWSVKTIKQWGDPESIEIALYQLER